MTSADGITVRGLVAGRFAEVLTPEALRFVAGLHREFNPARRALLDQRARRQAELDAGAMPDFLPETREIRESDWRVAPAPPDLTDRRVEITGPVDRKMIINALNSGARVFMADFEDATSPTWANVIEGQLNLTDAIDGTIEHVNPDGRVYRLGQRVATLMVRPRGWHLDEKHVLVDGQPVSASLFDFGLYLFRNAHRLAEKGTGPYYYLPKLEGHREARVWNEVFRYGEAELGLPRGTIRATVLVETILAAFEMDEILYELRERSAGLNAGRWDYIFSLIKKFRGHESFVLPDRGQVTMSVPFMRAYTELLVKTCHRRGAHAIGGMAAFIPSRRDPQANAAAIARVRADKVREANDGFDGTWVAHPDLVPVAAAVFDGVMAGVPNQLERLRESVAVSADDLLNVRIRNGKITEAGLRTNISVALQYLEAWLRGQGAVAINNLMEDAATAEICRAQVWQWTRHGSRLVDDGPQVTPALVRLLIQEELAAIRRTVGDRVFETGRYEAAAELFESMACGQNFTEFLTTAAYEFIN